MSPEMLGQHSKKSIKNHAKKQEIQKIEDINRLVVDLEIINVVSQNLTGDCILEMNNLNKTNNDLKNDYEMNYKRHLKRLLNETVLGVVFLRPLAYRATLLCQAKAIEVYKNNLDDFTTIFETAKIVCYQILKHRNWKLDGNFSRFDLPTPLSSLLRWIIAGPKNTVDTIFLKKINRQLY